MSASSSQGTTALSAAVALRDELVSSGRTYTVDRVERLVAGVRAQLDAAVAAIRSEHGVAGHLAVVALLDVAERLLVLAEELNTGRARVVSWTMPGAGNAALASFWYYGDVGRRAQLVELNRLPDPNRIPAGTVLRVLER